MKRHPIQIAPSLLAADLSRLGEEVHSLEQAGVDLFYFDIMDGHFVPNLTFGFSVIESLRRLTKLPFDAHLMIENADRYVEKFAEAVCNWVSVHVEACPHIHRTLQRIRSLGLKAGVAINPGTAISALSSVLDECDYTLVMSVNPGFAGQGFIGKALDRVRELKKDLGDSRVLIQMDGGIKVNNFVQVVEAGVDIVVMGTGLFEGKDYSKTVRTLRAWGGDQA